MKRSFKGWIYFILYVIVEFLLLCQEILSFFWGSLMKPFLIFWAANFALLLDWFFSEFLYFWFTAPLMRVLGVIFQKLLDLLMKFLENLCYFFFLIWELCGLREYKTTLALIFFLCLVLLLWLGYGWWLVIWYEGLCRCCRESGEARCSQMYFCLAYTTVIFLELRRRLKYYYQDNVLAKRKKK